MSFDLPNPEYVKAAFEQALSLAEQYRGATSPNPCVGAAALDQNGAILSVKAHLKAGTAHAEARVIEDLKTRGFLAEAHTLLVTLEPCNHTGRTPPCSDSIIKMHQDFGAFQKVIFICRDLNPKSKALGGGEGAQKLKDAGIEVHCLEDSAESNAEDFSKLVIRGQELIHTFQHWFQTGRPWVTIKTAFNIQGSMIPPTGEKTFTSETSLQYAHECRRRADAILTGSGTIFADHPLFTVRRVPDHPDKHRWLVILDRRGRMARLGREYIKWAESNGLKVKIETDIAKSLDFLGSQGCLEVLVEAGPTLSQAVLDSPLWNEHVSIRQQAGSADRIEVLRQK
jgi:diaminohydroxyphosphoribosylaminopyrimidine deaminase/5-amino-6-(5-phosphoribosylamino)uracil reductase